jgi:hypothetical protein
LGKLVEQFLGRLGAHMFKEFDGAPLSQRQWPQSLQKLFEALPDFERRFSRKSFLQYRFCVSAKLLQRTGRSVPLGERFAI